MSKMRSKIHFSILKIEIWMKVMSKAKSRILACRKLQISALVEISK